MNEKTCNYRVLKYTTDHTLQHFYWFLNE